MSWQDYVDKQLLASGFVNHAAIIGTDGSLWAKSAAFNVTIWQSFLSLLCVSFDFILAFVLSCVSVPNWRWGGAVCRAMLTKRHGSRHIWARSWPNFSCLFLLCQTTYLSFGKFEISIGSSDDEFQETRTTWWHAFLPMHVLKCVTLRAWVSCVGDLDSLLGNIGVCVWVEMHNMPSTQPFDYFSACVPFAMW